LQCKTGFLDSDNSKIVDAFEQLFKTTDQEVNFMDIPQAGVFNWNVLHC